MNSTANSETETTKKMFDHIQKEGPAVLLNKMGIDDFKFMSIENKWNESDDHKSIICNLVKEIREETAEVYIDMKHGQPTTDQVFDAVYGRGAKCKIRIIMYDGKESKEDVGNPAADEDVVESLIEAMNAYPLNLYLVKLESDDIEAAIDNMGDFEKPVPEYSMEELPSPDEFRRGEFWCVYFDSLDEEDYHPWKAFSDGIRDAAEWQLTLFTQEEAEIPLYWDNDGIKYIVKQKDESDDYLKNIWSSKHEELKKRYNGRVEFEYLPGKLPKITIHYSDRPISWLVTATSYEKFDFAIQLHDDFYGFRWYLDATAEEIEEHNPA
jgi:hypothetical protein